MHRTKLSILCSATVAFAITLAGCGGDDGGDDNNSDSTGATTDDPTTGSPTGNPSTDDSTSDDPTTAGPTTDDPTTGDPTTGDPTEDTGPDPDSTSAGTEDTGTGGGMVCEPEGDDDECQTCTKAMCCDELEACAADADCACVLECLSMEENPGIPEAMMCATECMADFLMVAVPLMAVDSCRMMSCAKDCAG